MTSPETLRSVYPIEWFSRTFTNPERTAELLRAEVENGIITPADYQRSQDFFPASFRLHKFGYGMAGAGLIVAYGLTRKPRWNGGRLTVASTVGYFGGSLFGTYQQANAHIRFQVGLEDPAGLERAMENVNKRLGGVEPLHVSFKWARKERAPSPRNIPGSVLADAPPSEDDWNEPPTSTRPPPSSAPVSRPVTEAIKESGRWAEIRKVNTGSAQGSSWDKHRQDRDSSQRPAANPGAEQGESFPSSYVDDRARQQAEFDALLEAERRLGSDDSRPRFDGVSSS